MSPPSFFFFECKYIYLESHPENTVRERKSEPEMGEKSIT